MRAGYVFSEVLTGLRRNITMTVAMILTTAISLSLLGGGLIVARVSQATQVLYGDKVEVIIYLNADLSNKDPNCTAVICQNISASLKKNADVELSTYQTQADAFQQYKARFAGQPEMLAIVQQDALPASFHVKLHDPQRFKVISQQFTGLPGVDSVNDQSAFLNKLFGLLNGVRNLAIIVALIQAFAALLLISNMVQIAAYTRRTETSIMRLVGASRWRTQLPFMIEAVVAGVIGALLSIGLLVVAKVTFVDKLLGSVINSGVLAPLTGTDLVAVAPWLLLAGAGLAAISGYVTLRLYVRI
ncbi:permease-like cell division protein FtsX [Nakamurella sp. PAMC28650]|jgi:cell division transport system permease protein|uniref:permease-like cell division protein FtsX n=1 Tax=Nakamurella sp. PAMC28650 TaxID=2762325 RepID=UPI00164DA09D|nr:permease-like cell division protein FtsX [Nakamurella sp. PAMC28650]QNK80562.1 ABC transporter permease [Nakamurella sp. PAMC28650]